MILVILSHSVCSNFSPNLVLFSVSWRGKERGWESLEPKAKGPFRIIGSEAIQAERQKQLLRWRTLYGQPPSRMNPFLMKAFMRG
jgi:hypothetical protein